MASVEHAYAYPFDSSLQDERGVRSLRLATSGGPEAHPHFFRGRLTSPRRAADLLLAVSEVAATRFFVPAATIARQIREADPVVTSGGERLRFESFSVCCGVYARCDLRPEAIDGEWVGRGTTNVDFGPKMRSALSVVHDGERVGLHVGADSVALDRDGATVVERRVKLPTRWLRGFVEVQCYQASMRLVHELAPADAHRFLASLPREVPASGSPGFVVSQGRSLRLTQRSAPGAVMVGGPARLRTLASLVRAARALRVYANDEGVSGWELVFEDARFHLVLSPEPSRGFSGEGQALFALADAAGETVLARVRGALKWQARLTPGVLAAELGLEDRAVAGALARLGARGLVGFDLDDDCWFHRELPFDLAAIDALQPRLVDARSIVADGSIRLGARTGGEQEVWVRGTDVEHLVRVTSDDARCTCPWFSRNQGARGPCKHILAARIFLAQQPSA
jgi:hypothetical protein